MKRISTITGLCSLSAIYLVATVSHIGQQQGDIFGTMFWMLAAVPGGMWLAAQALGAFNKGLHKFGYLK
jgi:hypothetical protein